MKVKKLILGIAVISVTVMLLSVSGFADSNEDGCPVMVDTIHD